MDRHPLLVEFISTITGECRPATRDEAAQLGDLPALHLPEAGGLLRRLSLSHPDDRRAIWRLAAVRLGVDLELAELCVLHRAPGGLVSTDGRVLWGLYLDRTLLRSVWTVDDTAEGATAALCVDLGPHLEGA